MSKLRPVITDTATTHTSVEMFDACEALFRKMMAENPVAVTFIWEKAARNPEGDAEISCSSVPDSIALRDGMIDARYRARHPPPLE